MAIYKITWSDFWKILRGREPILNPQHWPVRKEVKVFAALVLFFACVLPARADQVVEFTWEVNVEQDMINGATETLSGSLTWDETSGVVSNIVLPQSTGFLSTYNLTESTQGFIWNLEGANGFFTTSWWIVGNTLGGMNWSGIVGCPSDTPLTADQVVGLDEGLQVFPPCGGDDVTYSAAFIFPGTGDPPIITPEPGALILLASGLLGLYWLGGLKLLRA